MSEISGSTQTAIAVGNTGPGLKTEARIKIPFTDAVSLNTHSEFKGGLPQTPVDELTTADWYVHGIYKPGFDLPLLKSLSLSGTFDPGIEVGGGWTDMGRDLTTNGFGTLGLKTASTLSRNPYAFFVERPNHLFPGSNPGAWVQYSQKIDNDPLNDAPGYRLFAGLTNARKSSGMFGLKLSEGDEGMEMAPILPAGPEDPFFQGIFGTAGGTIGYAVSDEVQIALDASLSFRSTPAEEGVTWGLMPYVGAALELKKRLTLFGDLSFIVDPKNAPLHQTSGRFLGDITLADKDKFDVSLFGVYMGTAVPAGAVVTEEEVIVVNEGNSAVIGQDPVEETTTEVTTEETIERNGGSSLVFGPRLVLDLSEATQLALSADGGILNDSRLSQPHGVFDARAELKWKF